jgi:hypothetical protein
MTRKRILSPELIEQLCAYVRQGNYNVTAVQACGIHERTFYSWLERGKRELEVRPEDGTEPESLYMQLLQSLKKSEAEAQIKIAKVVTDCAVKDGQWLAGMTFLERRWPDQYGRRERKQVDIHETRHIEVHHVEVIRPQEAVETMDYKLLPLGEGGENIR